MKPVALITHTESLDSELLDLIDLIDTYHISSNFCDWLSEGQYQQHLIYENYQPNKYIRITQYTINDMMVFTGKHEFYLNKLDITFRKKITSPIVDISASYLESIGFRKKKIARIAAESSYTVVSQNYIQDDLIALSWEIYELTALQKIYTARKGPLKYWMSLQRE
jgi:hypothetical protein